MISTAEVSRSPGPAAVTFASDGNVPQATPPCTKS